MRDKLIPGPDGGPLGLDVLRAFQRDPLPFLAAQRAAHGDLVRLPFGPDDLYLLAHPDLVREALVAQGDKLVKWARARPPFERVARCNLVIMEGDAWAEVRRLVAPTLLLEALGPHVAPMAARAAAACDAWDEGAVVEVDPWFSRVHLANLVGCLVGVDDVARAMPDFTAALELIMGAFMADARTPVRLPEWIPTPHNVERGRARALVDATLAGLLRDRHAPGGARGDLLSALADASDPASGRRLTDEELTQLVLSLFVAGRETPVRALTWSLSLLAQHPEVQARLRRDLDAAGEARGVGDLRRVPLLFQAIDEALRCYPPAWSLVFREAVAPVTLGGHTLPAGSVLYMCTHLLHHDARAWPEPERFDPERFAHGWEARVPEGSYVPFGVGPRACAGRHLAVLEVAVTLATVLRRFEVAPEGDAVAAKAGFTLEPAAPLRLRVKRRARG